jgi:hypothetical protein
MENIWGKIKNLLADKCGFPTFPPPDFFGIFTSAAVMWFVIAPKRDAKCRR